MMKTQTALLRITRAQARVFTTADWILFRHQFSRGLFFCEKIREFCKKLETGQIVRQIQEKGDEAPSLQATMKPQGSLYHCAHSSCLFLQKKIVFFPLLLN